MGLLLPLFVLFVSLLTLPFFKVHANSDITLAFTGTITKVNWQCPNPEIFKGATVGDSWTLTYTFTTTAGDVDPNPTAGQYRNLITDMTLEIGSTTVSGTPGAAIPGGFSSVIAVNLGLGYADYVVQTGLPDASAWATVILSDDSGTPFTDDSLPLDIPTPLDVKFPDQRYFSLRAFENTQICILGIFEIKVHIDIKPGSWPNPINPKSKGVFAVAICGSEYFNIMSIDPASVTITIETDDNEISPLRWSYEDVVTPYTGDPGGGHTLGGDGYMDLVLHFKTQEVVTILGLNAYAGEIIPLIIQGTLHENGNPLQGQDYVWIL